MTDFIAAAEAIENHGHSLKRIATDIHNSEVERGDPKARAESTIISQLSNAMSGFSETLGLRLTTRGAGSSLELTQAGRDFLGALVSARQSFDLFFKIYSEENPLVNFRIGGSDTVLEWVVIPYLDKIDEPFGELLNQCLDGADREFKESDISISLEEFEHPHEFINKLNTALLDLAIFRSVVPPEQESDRLVSVKIGDISYKLFVPEALLDKAKSRSPEPFMLSVLSNSGNIELGDAVIQTEIIAQTGLENIRVRVRRYDHSFQRMFSVFNRFETHAAVFPNIVPVHKVWKERKDRKLQEFEIQALPPAEPLWLAYNKNALGNAVDLHFARRSDQTSKLVQEFAKKLALRLSDAFVW